MTNTILKKTAAAALVLSAATVSAMAPTIAEAKTRAVIINSTGAPMSVDGIVIDNLEGKWANLDALVVISREGGSTDAIFIDDTNTKCTDEKGKKLRRTWRLDVKGEKVEKSSTCIKLKFARVGCVFAVVRYDSEKKIYKVDMEVTDRKKCRDGWTNTNKVKMKETAKLFLEYQRNAVDALAALAKLKGG